MHNSRLYLETRGHFAASHPLKLIKEKLAGSALTDGNKWHFKFVFNEQLLFCLLAAADSYCLIHPLRNGAHNLSQPL